MRYTLKFVNNGEPFEIPNWTPKKHEAALTKLLNDTQSIAEEERNQAQDKMFKYYVIYETLVLIDKKVTLQDIENMHPIDLIQLFDAVYNAGKQGIIYKEDFQEGEETPKKSTGKMS